jgi:Rrf2 family protein
MRISRKAEYALRALLLLARGNPDKVHQIQEVSEAGRIPVKFLEQILLTLRNHGILSSKRGVGGGYTLKRRPSEMSVLAKDKRSKAGTCFVRGPFSVAHHGGAKISARPTIRLLL